ncbi:MAG: tetratricopeptide repeat protein [Pseudomonadota bacterium]
MTQEGLFPNIPEVGYIVQGKYRLEHKLSEGGSGVVWAALDPQGKRVALKFLKWSPVKSRSEVADRFKNEFAILKTLSHPNIGQIYDFGLDAQSGFYFFTSELLTAGDFRKLVGAPVPVLEDMLLQALRALEYLRGHKLLHLDIKPHNLLLRELEDRQALALIDFGLATFRPPERPGGTPNYMAPELIVMRLCDETQISYPPPDHRSDLYSLGVTFYHCLTGVQPFCVTDSHGKIDVMGTLKKHLDFDPPPPSAHRPEIPAYLDRIIMKLMARHPDDRYPSAIVAAQALQYSSSRKREPECLQTLLAYLPKEGKLIGRHREFALIEESMKAVAKGTPHVAPIVCIAGGCGVGRSRLLQAVKPLAQQLEMDVCAFNQGDPPTSTALEELLNEDASKGPPVRAILIDDLDEILKHETMDALTALLRRLRLQQRVPDTPAPRFFLVFSLNTDQTNLSRAMMDLELDHAVCHIVELTNFAKKDVSEYLGTLLGEAPDESVVDQLMQCTGGNPLYITEHLEQMISEGRLFSLAGRPDAGTLKAIGIDFSQAAPPKSLAESVMETLASLSAQAQKTALLLACWHRPTSIDEIKQTADGEQTDKEVLALIGCGLIRRDKTNGYLTFINALSARIIIDRSPRKQIAASHDAIANYLKSKRTRKPADLDIHLAYGSDPSERVPALMRMAKRALAGNEPLEAAAHLETLFELIGETDWANRAEVLVMLGKAYERAYHNDEAKTAYRRIRKIEAPKILKNELKALAAEHLGRLSMWLRELPEARKHLNDALNLLKEDKHYIAERLRIQNYLSAVELREGHIEKAVSEFERNAEVAKRLLSSEELHTVTNNELGEALLRKGDAKQAIEILSKELGEDHIEDMDDAIRIANNHLLIGTALRHDDIKEYKQALKHYKKALRLARAHRMIRLQVRVQTSLGNLYLKMGKYEEAIRHYQESLKIAQQTETITTSVEILINMGLVSQQMGENPERTIEYFEAALDFSKTPKGSLAGFIRNYRPTIYASLGNAYFLKGNLKRAKDYLNKAIGMDKKHRLSPDIRYSLYATSAEIDLQQGHYDAAKKYMPTIEAMAKAYPPAQKHCEKLKKRIEGS